MELAQLRQIEVELAGARATTSARVYPAQAPHATLILAHGAGAPQGHPWMIAMSEALAARGVAVVTFNFLYAEQHKRAPDRKPALEATWLAVLEAVRARAGALPLFIGGKSMGGRIATQVAAREGVEVAGLVLLGYPLHPPGQPERLRTAHLKDVRAPMLFVQGERDELGGPDELAPHLEGLRAKITLLPIAGGDHSLATPRRSGVTLEQTMARVADAVAAFTRPAVTT